MTGPWLLADRAPLEAGAWIPLDADGAGHVRVLRLGPGARVEVFDGRGRHAPGSLEVRDGALGARLLGAPASVAPPRWTLVHALPKGDKLDDVVRMATEIGVAAIHLAHTERTVARPRGERAEKQVARLVRIARAAAAQAEQAWAPEVHAPAPLEEVAARAPATALRLVAAPRGGASLGALAPAALAAGAWVAIGPEGGLSPGEEAALARAGWQGVALATGILRTETAAAVFLGALVGRAAG